MDPQRRALISAVHHAGYRWVVAVTGGGAEAVGWLLSVPGGSRSILEVIVPYDEHSLADFLGYYPSSFCSLQTACAMADRALQRARWLASGEPVLGLACTASLRSDKPKRGAHRFHLAIQTSLHVLTISLTLTKDARTREEEELIVDLLFLNAMAESLGLPERVDVPLLPNESIEQQTLPSENPLTSLFAGRLAAVCVQPDGHAGADVSRPQLILSGSFNPLHAGHIALAKSATERTGFKAAFELTILNADKPPLPPEEVRRRMAFFTWQAPLWLTRAATFVEKAELFPGVVFVVGSDTAERIVQSRFYGGSEEQLALAMNRLRQLGCRFLVAGRVKQNGDFVGLDTIEIPENYLDLFASIPAERFRVDLSSTQLRQAEDESKRSGGVSC